MNPSLPSLHHVSRAVLTGIAILMVYGGLLPAQPPEQRPDHHRFADAERWARVFEDSARDAWQRPEAVIAALDLKPASLIADIGSATGYFPVRFARAATAGKVYGIDIEASLVEYLNARAQKEALPNLVSILGRPEDPLIPEPVDIIFICDTYHHITDRVAYFRNLQKYLRPNGTVVIVDFKMGNLPVGPSDRAKLPPEEVVRELAEAGWVRQPCDLELPYQYILRFGVAGN